MVSFGEDIRIFINIIDYSTSISNISESGGEREFITKKMIGNNYKKIEIGRTNYELSFTFKMEGTTLNSLYEITNPTTIYIIGSDFTITYYNMLPKSLKLKQEVDGIATGELVYSAPAYDNTNNRYNRVIV